MEEVYKGHRILASTWQLSDSRHWEARVFVTWTEGQQQKTASVVFTRSFATQSEAELEGIKCAKKWIDDGKADLHVGPT
jgi:hypothetical protein